MKKLIKNNVNWVGYMDWELESFHGDEYSIYNGSSQNAYLIEEEKTLYMDTGVEVSEIKTFNDIQKIIEHRKNRAQKSSTECEKQITSGYPNGYSPRSNSC